MKKLVSVLLLVVLLCEALPVEALAYGGKVLSQAEIARAKALTGLSFGKEANTTAYHSGMKPNAGWNASQLRDWLDEKLDKDLDSVCDNFSQAFFTLSELKQSNPGKYRSFSESELYETARSLFLQAEELREDMRYYRDQLKEASGVIAEMSRWLTEESSALFDSDQARYSMRIKEAAREIVNIRGFIAENADGWTADIAKLQEYQQSGPPEGLNGPGIGTWMTGLLNGNDGLIVESAPITRVSAVNTRASRLMRASGLADDQEASVTVYTDNEVVILLQAEADGKLVAVDGASVMFRDALRPDSQWEERPYDNGCVLVPINKLTADEFEVFHLALNIDPTGQGYRDISFEDLDLERGAPYTCILTPLDSPANSLGDASPYAYMMSFNGKDIMQSEYEMIYSPANDYEFEIHVGVRNPSGQTLPKLLMRYYQDTVLVPQKETWAEPVRQDGDVYVFKGAWKQLFSPYASESQRPTFMFGKDASASMTFPSQLVSVKGATDNPINEGTGPDGGVFANVLGEGLSMNLKIPVVDINVGLNLPLKKYLPKLCINPAGYIVIYVGSDMMKDDISKISWANWKSKDLKEFKRAQQLVEKKGAAANYEAQYGLAKDYYQQKRFKCLANTSLELGWFAVATGRWELDDSIPDILSRDVTLKLGTGFTASLAVSWTMSYPIGPVPAYVTFTIGVSAGFAMEFSLYLNWVNGQFQDWEFIPIAEITIDIGIMVAAQLGVGIKGFVEGFAKLAASLDVVLHLSLQDTGSLKVMFELNFTVGVTMFFVTFSKSWNIARVQLYPPESAGNLLAHYMNADGDDPEADETAYGEPQSYPALAAKAEERAWTVNDYGNWGPAKVVSCNGNLFAFRIFKDKGADGKQHSRAAYHHIDPETGEFADHQSLQVFIDNSGTGYRDTINQRDDYDFDVFSTNVFIFVLATSAKEFDEDGYPVRNDMSSASKDNRYLNQIAWMMILYCSPDGALSTNGIDFLRCQSFQWNEDDQHVDYSYDSLGKPHISFARYQYGAQGAPEIEMYGEIGCVAYPDDPTPAGTTGIGFNVFIDLPGGGSFLMYPDKSVKSGMGDGYEFIKTCSLMDMDAFGRVDTSRASYVNMFGMSFVGLSRPKDGAEGDNALELYAFGMNDGDRTAIVLDQGDIGNIVAVKDRAAPEGERAGTTVFYTLGETNGDGATRYRLCSVHIGPVTGQGTPDLEYDAARYEYDAVLPTSVFDIRFLGEVPYLYWTTTAPKDQDSDPDVWRVWTMPYDSVTNTLGGPAVFSEFTVPYASYTPAGPSGSPTYRIENPLLKSVMLTGKGTAYVNVAADDLESMNDDQGPARAPVSVCSIPEMLTPSASVISAVPQELVVKAGSFDDFTVGVMNDGNMAITAFDLALYDVNDSGDENLVETAHIDALDPTKNAITMADGTVALSGETTAYRQEDYDNTSRKHDWVLDHESIAYKIHAEGGKTAVEKQTIEPSDTQHITTDIIMPGSAVGYTVAYKIPDDWAAGTRALRIKLTSASTFANWMRAAGLAAGVRTNGSTAANANGELVELKYVLNERTGKLELQRAANFTASLNEAIQSGLITSEFKTSSVPVTVEVHDLEVSHRVYRGLGGERWLDISIRNHAATREGMKLVCAVYVDGAEEPSHYINLPYYENAALSHKTQTVSLPVSALVDDPGAHRTARVEILSVNRDERAYANNEFTVYLDGKNTLHFIQQPEDVIAREGEDVSFSVAVDGGKKPYSYQWQFWDENHRKWVDLPGFTEPILIWENVEKKMDGWKFRCVVTDAAGTKIISREATLHVWSDVPTGDSSNLPMYLTIAALALAAMVVLWRRRRKA